MLSMGVLFLSQVRADNSEFETRARGGFFHGLNSMTDPMTVGKQKIATAEITTTFMNEDFSLEIIFQRVTPARMPMKCK